MTTVNPNHDQPSLSTQFLNLVTAFHLDAAGELVDELATRFAVEVAAEVYRHKCRSLTLACVKREAAEHFQNVYHYLLGYGLCLSMRPLRKQPQAAVIGVRLLGRQEQLALLAKGYEGFATLSVSVAKTRVAGLEAKEDVA